VEIGTVDKFNKGAENAQYRQRTLAACSKEGRIGEWFNAREPGQLSPKKKKKSDWWSARGGTKQVKFQHSKGKKVGEFQV